MTRKTKDYLFESYLAEYQKHRDEMQNRINLQNGMAQRGQAITALAATLLVSLYTFIMQGQGDKELFMAVTLAVLFTHGILIQLILASWIYQLHMIFKIKRYWNWMVIHKIEPLIGKQEIVFLWDLPPDEGWENELDRGPVELFQPLFVYTLCVISLIGLPLVINWKPENPTYTMLPNIGIRAFALLTISFIIIGSIHVWLAVSTILSMKEAKAQRKRLAAKKASQSDKESDQNKTAPKENK